MPDRACFIKKNRLIKKKKAVTLNKLLAEWFRCTVCFSDMLFEVAYIFVELKRHINVITSNIAEAKYL